MTAILSRSQGNNHYSDIFGAGLRLLQLWMTNSIFDYSDVIMGAMVSQIIGVSIVYSIVCSDADQSKNQSFASLAFLRGIHWRPVNPPDRGPVTRKLFPFDDAIMSYSKVPNWNQWKMQALSSWLIICRVASHEYFSVFNNLKKMVRI